jgi:rod shape-determining protein MreC
VKRYTYIFIALFVLCQLSLPTTASDRFRSISVAALSPSWNFLSQTKERFLKLAAILPSDGATPHVQREIDSMRLEIHNLHDQLELLKAQVDLEKLVVEEAELLKYFAQDDAYAKRRKAEIFRLVDLYAPSIIGKVIFRETASWSSSFWINLGEKTNQALGKKLIAKNSPVVVGTSVLGIVEYVGQHRSRVRLITDSSIAPSVRILRGSEQTKVIADQARKLLVMLESYNGISKDQPIKKELNQFLQNLHPDKENFYLAKGEMRGMRGPLFRSRNALLQGVGFNYDFEDEEGPSRDLRSGKPVNQATEEVALVKKGDVLVTTGMDGIFPAGLRVGQVTEVHPLREGASAYELDALPLIGNFDNISFVAVLPPLDSNPTD